MANGAVHVVEFAANIDFSVRLGQNSPHPGVCARAGVEVGVQRAIGIEARDAHARSIGGDDGAGAGVGFTRSAEIAAHHDFPVCLQRHGRAPPVDV